MHITVKIPVRSAFRSDGQVFDIRNITIESPIIRTESTVILVIEGLGRIEVEAQDLDQAVHRAKRG